MTKKGRPVVLRIKGQLGSRIYPSVAALCKENGKEKIGIELQALWNALSRGRGKFENRHCTVRYKTINIKPKEWK